MAMVLAALTLLAACEREERRFREIPPTYTASGAVRQGELQAGPAYVTADVRHPYEENAWAISQGQRLFNWFNCVGCHANGGGSMGPPLMDDEWIYGSEPENIFQTLVQGRPNGMPSFGGRISNQQLWQLVAYVRSLSGLTPMDTRPSRPDAMQAKEPQNLMEPAQPKNTGIPSQSERP